MVQLEAMDEADYDEYLEWAVGNYASEKVKSGAWTEEGSVERARGEYNRYLPNGIATENNFLYRIMGNDGSTRVGVLWLGILPSGSEMRGIFIWDIVIRPEYRGKGLGTETMEAIEHEAKRLGQTRISLHVFGHNAAAIALYRKTGYSATDLIMSKEI